MRESRKSSNNEKNWAYVKLLPKASNKGYNLESSIRFAGARSQKLHFKFGSVKIDFGFKRCELCLRIRNGQMPMRFRWPAATESTTVNVEEEVQIVEESDDSHTVGVSVRPEGANFELAQTKYRPKRNWNRSWLDDYHEVLALGPDESPKWKFRKVESGCLDKAYNPNLGRLLADDNRCEITYYFEFNEHDINVLHMDWGIDIDLSEDRKGRFRAIFRKLAKIAVYSNFGPFMSKSRIEI